MIDLHRDCLISCLQKNYPHCVTISKKNLQNFETESFKSEIQILPRLSWGWTHHFSPPPLPDRAQAPDFCVAAPKKSFRIHLSRNRRDSADPEQTFRSQFQSLRGTTDRRRRYLLEITMKPSHGKQPGYFCHFFFSTLLEFVFIKQAI